MKLAWKELKYFKKKYFFIELMIVLLVFMVLFLSGLANGLGRAVSAGIEDMDATHFLMSDSSENLIPISHLETGIYEQLKEQTTSKVAPLDIQRMYLCTEKGGNKLDVAYFAIEKGSFLEPDTYEGTSLEDATVDHGIILDDSFAAEGIAVGDTVYDSTTEMEFTVVGFTKDRMYGHVGAAYLTTESYTDLRTSMDSKYKQAYHAFAIEGDDVAGIDIPGAMVVDKKTVIENIPGYKAEQVTINMIVWVLVVISAAIIGVFYYIISLQKERQFGVMRALGMETREIALSVCSQVAMVACIGAAIANLLTFGMAAMLPEAMPFYLKGSSVALVTVVFIIVSLLSSLLSLQRVAKVDPIIAMGGVE